MTRQQAEAEFKRLCGALGGNPKGMNVEEKGSWMRVLEALSYERGRAAVTHLIDNHPYNTFPRSGALNRAAKEVSLEGQPNAGAYSQNGANQSHDADRDRLAVERQEHWIQMNDDEYFDTVVLPLAASGRMWARGG